MRLPGEVHGSNGPLSMSEVPRKVPAVCGVISHYRFGPPTRMVRTPGGIEAPSEQALETLPGGESPLDASRGRLLDSQSGDAETSFDVLDDLRDRDGDQEVQPGDDGERLKRLPLEERLAPPDFRELDDPDDEEQRTRLQQADVFVRQGRDDETKGLWQDHVSHRLPPGEPDRPCGLDLARVDGLDSCAKDLALIPSGVRRQRDQTGYERKLVRIQTRETDHEDRANEHDLNEEGRSADRSDVSIAHPTERVLHAEYGGPLRTRLAHRNTSRPRPSDDESDAHPDDVRHGCHVEGNPRAPQIDRPRAGNVRPTQAVPSNENLEEKSDDANREDDGCDRVECSRALSPEVFEAPHESPEDLAHERPRPFLLRVFKDFLRVAFLEDHPAVHEDDSPGDVARKSHFVGHDDHRHPVAGQGRHHVEDIADVLRVQGGRGFVEQHGLGIHGQRPRNRDPLLLAARQLRGVGVCFRRQPDPRQELLRLIFRLFSGHALHSDGAEHDVLLGGEVSEEVETLEHHADLLSDPLPVNVVAIHMDPVDEHAARVRFDQEIDAAQERALARSARADDDESLGFRHVEGDPSEDMKRAEVLVDVLHADHTETPSRPRTWNFLSRNNKTWVTAVVMAKYTRA